MFVVCVWNLTIIHTYTKPTHTHTTYRLLHSWQVIYLFPSFSFFYLWKIKASVGFFSYPLSCFLFTVFSQWKCIRYFCFMSKHPNTQKAKPNEKENISAATHLINLPHTLLHQRRPDKAKKWRVPATNYFFFCIISIDSFALCCFLFVFTFCLNLKTRKLELEKNVTNLLFISTLSPAWFF